MLFNVFRNTRSRNPNLSLPLSYIRKKRTWISATQTANYMLNDTLVDWMKKHYRHDHPSPSRSDHKDYLLEAGIKFEKEVVDYIHNNLLQVCTVSEFITDKSLQQTIKYMSEGRPLIHSAPIRNKYNSTQGVIDLLVRSDYINHLSQTPLLEDHEIHINSPKLGVDYYYIPIDIKFSTLKLSSDGKHLLNSDRYPAYKSQLCIYNQAIGHIQGYQSQYAFIMGRRWTYTSKGIKHWGDDFTKTMGKIDFKNRDNEYIEKTRQAISWLRKVEVWGHRWSASPPSRPELFPNMCRDSGSWQRVKRKLAIKNKELTLLWNVGVKHRQNALNHNIKSWDDPTCDSHHLGINGARKKVIDKILHINRHTSQKISPTRITSNLHDWRNNSNEVFVDFETMLDMFYDKETLPHQPKKEQIFMIGVGYRQMDKWNYKSFTCNALTLEEEYRIMNEFVEFMNSLGNPRIWYWSAEKRFWHQSCNKQFEEYEEDTEKSNKILQWEIGELLDLSNLFRQEPITIKGCFGFGLKEIAEAMRNHGLITTKIESETSSGTVAAFKAWEVYNTHHDPENSAILKDIEEYNQFDCRVLSDILEYLRNNH